MIIKTIYIAPFLQASKGALGTGHYSSPGGGGGDGGRRIFWGGSVITENPKGGGSLKTVEGQTIGPMCCLLINSIASHFAE